LGVFLQHLEDGCVIGRLGLANLELKSLRDMFLVFDIDGVITFDFVVARFGGKRPTVLRPPLIVGFPIGSKGKSYRTCLCGAQHVWNLPVSKLSLSFADPFIRVKEQTGSVWRFKVLVLWSLQFKPSRIVNGYHRAQSCLANVFDGDAQANGFEWK